MATSAKDLRLIRKLEIRIEELERHFKISQQHYVDTFHELFETRTAMRQAYEAICEAEKVLREQLQNDPVFMAGKPKAEIIGDF